MNGVIEIPRGDYDTPGPCWIPHEWEGKNCKPIIKCKCGHISHIGLHHVHTDGTVTASFFHDSAPHPDIGYAGGGCGWHVWLKLKDYDLGDFPTKS
jgi:hypothetical protein